MILLLISCSYLSNSDLNCYSLKRRYHYLNNETSYLNSESIFLKKENLEKRLSDKKYSIAKVSIDKRLHQIDAELFSIEEKLVLNDCKSKE